MIKTVLHLVYIQWRKFFVKDDYFSLCVFLAGLAFSLQAIYKHYADYSFLLFLFPIHAFFHHLGRNDLSLLKGNRYFRMILFGEYLINGLPALLLFSLKNDFLHAIGYLVFLVTLVFLPQKSMTVRYPFVLFDPFWHVSFRKYKLILLMPIAVFLVFLGKMYENFNLSVFGILSTAFIGIIPYFEREFKIHIYTSVYSPKKYLHKQIATGYINFLWILASVFLFVLTFWGLEVGWLFLLLFFVPLLGILSKYAYFGSPLSQIIICIFSAATFQYGLFVFVLPFLYRRALSQLKFEKIDVKN